MEVKSRRRLAGWQVPQTAPALNTAPGQLLLSDSIRSRSPVVSRQTAGHSDVALCEARAPLCSMLSDRYHC